MNIKNKQNRWWILITRSVCCLNFGCSDFISGVEHVFICLAVSYSLTICFFHYTQDLSYLYSRQHSWTPDQHIGGLWWMCWGAEGKAVTVSSSWCPQVPRLTLNIQCSSNTSSPRKSPKFKYLYMSIHRLQQGEGTGWCGPASVAGLPEEVLEGAGDTGSQAQGRVELQQINVFQSRA